MAGPVRDATRSARFVGACVAGLWWAHAAHAQFVAYDPFPIDAEGLFFNEWFRGQPHVMDDATLQSTTARIVQIDVPVLRDSWPSTPNNADLVIRLWTEGDYANQSILYTVPADCRLIASDVIEDAGSTVPPGLIAFNYVTWIPAQPIAITPVAQVWVEFEWRAAVAGLGNGGTGAALLPPVGTTRQQPFGFWGWRADSGPSTGSTLDPMAVDSNNNGVFAGLSGAPSEIVATSPGQTVRLGAVIYVQPQPRRCDSIDFNNDCIFPDSADAIAFLDAFVGLPCAGPFSCNDIDFNNDGVFPDNVDLVTFLTVFAGGPCN
jgi:hypothetical protein